MPHQLQTTVFRWDLDKTYLRTDFDTARGLLRTAFEAPWHKKTVPGAAALLRALQRSGAEQVHILSGSPQQMRPVLAAKLKRDGIRWQSFTLKPSLRNLRRGRFRYLKEQLGYKLGSLLHSRLTTDPGFDEVLFGDDAEADAFVYSLYADICAGVVERAEVEDLLEIARVFPEDRQRIVDAFDAVSKRACVRRIFVHLDRVCAPSDFEALGRRVCPIYNYFQAAVLLHDMGLLGASETLNVGLKMATEDMFSPDALLASILDLAARTALDREKLRALAEAEGEEAFATLQGGIRSRVDELALLSDEDEPKIDYLALHLRDRRRARQAKERALWRFRK